MLTHSTAPYAGTVNGLCLKVSWFILVLYSCITLAYSSGGDIDIIYLNDGRVIKGKIVSGGKSSDYYVQIETKTEYLNFYMTEVREIKTSEADINKPPPVVKKAQSVREDPPVKLIEDTGQVKSDTKPKQQHKVQRSNRVNILGGITYSTIAGDEVEDAKNLLGFRFGIESELVNSPITVGATLSQRGYSYSEKYDYEYYEDSEKYDYELTLNYLTGYALYRTSLSPVIDLLVGPELGYFLNGEIKSEWCYYGDCESDTQDIDSDDWEDADNNILDIGLVFGGRYAINQQISIVGTYYFGLADWGEKMEFVNRSFQVYLRYSL